MRAADLLPKLLVILEDDADAIVCVFNRVLVAKPKTCAAGCDTWQDAALNPDECAATACDAMRQSRNKNIVACTYCDHHPFCHQLAPQHAHSTPARSASPQKPTDPPTDVKEDAARDAEHARHPQLFPWK